MGTVYEAYDPGLGRRVAIKLFRKNLSGSNKPDNTARASRDALVAEARALARINHPNVVSIFDIGTSQDRVYLAMEFLRGRTLRHWVGECNPSWSQIVRVYLGLARGLAAIHRVQLVHLDFKPDNVIIDEQNHARIVDFGLAVDEAENAGDDSWRRQTRKPSLPTHPGEEEPTLTTTTTLLAAQPSQSTRRAAGTPAYMSPEQHIRGTITPASDQYSFCVALYESLFRQRPFTAKSARAYHRLKVEFRLSVPRKRGRLPRRLLRVLERGLQVDPRNRYADMQELIDDLEGSIHRSTATAVSLAMLGMVSLGTTATWLEQTNEDNLRCQEMSARSEEIWSNSIAREIDLSFHRTQHPSAGELYQRIANRFTRIASDFREMQDQVCAAQQGERAAKPPVPYVQQQTCLDERLTETHDMLQVLREVNRNTLHKSPDLVMQMPSPLACKDPSAFRVFLPTPNDPAKARQVTALRREIRRATAQIKLSQFDYHGDFANRTTETARKIGYLPLMADAALFKASVEMHGARPMAVASNFQHAIVTGESGEIDHFEVSALSLYAFLRGYREGQVEEAEELLQHAMAHNRRVGNPPELLGDIYVRSAAIMSAASQWERAERLANLALLAYSKTSASVPRSLATAYNNLGVVQFGQGRYEDALHNFNEARLQTIARLGPNHPELLFADGNIALSAACLGELDVANQASREAIELYERTSCLPNEPLIRARFQLGENLAARGDRAGGLKEIRASLALYEQISGVDAPDSFEAWARIAYLEAMRGNWLAAREAADQTYRLLKIAEANGKPMRESEWGYAALTFTYEMLGEGAMANETGVLALRRIARLSPTEPGPIDLYYRREIQRHTKAQNFGEAHRVATRALLGPGLPAYRELEVRLVRARIGLDLGLLSEAESDAMWIEKRPDLLRQDDLASVYVDEIRASLALARGEVAIAHQYMSHAFELLGRTEHWRDSIAAGDVERLTQLRSRVEAALESSNRN
jgi:serine/threonine protein kinase